MLANRVRMGSGGGNWLANLPGNKSLIVGNMTTGYFGEVTVDEFFTPDEIGRRGQPIEMDANWFKFALDGKVLYVAKARYSHSLSYDTLNRYEMIKGNKVVEKEGIQYKVRVLEGALNNFANGTSDLDGSEWNRLLIPMTNGVFASFSASDLRVVDGLGFRNITSTVNGTNVLLRGHGSISGHIELPTNYGNSTVGWRPVLEVIK